MRYDLLSCVLSVTVLTIGPQFSARFARAGDEGILKVSSRPLHQGRISPMLLGNFIELLDDLVPGMRAEMLNDRGFEGVVKRSDWCFYNGEPNACDRPWNENETWSYETDNPFNGPRCVKLTPSPGRVATLTQSGLAVRKGMTYVFSGFLDADNSNVRAKVVLKVMLPDGQWMELGSAELPELSGQWKKYTTRITSRGATDRVVFELRVVGQGSVRVDKLSLTPVSNIEGWRPDVVDAIRQVRPAVIRWGGSVCDPGGYRWKTGIGSRDLRLPFPNTVWGRIDSNDVGVDEFCQFCKLVDAEPLICLSFSDGPQSAADLVQYCNGAADTPWGAKRAANGHPEPYGVKYWQLGNEISGNDDNYVNGCPAFCRAMKQADPDVRLLSSFPSRKLLAAVGEDIAYVGPHHYTPDFAACEADFKKLSEMIEETPGCGHIKIAVTEWNVSAGYFGLMRGKFLTLETAMLNARYLNLMFRYSDIVEIACRSNMTNSLGSGIVATNAAGLHKRPSYHVMKLYADHMRPTAVRVENVPQGVDISACMSREGGSLCIFVVNTRNEPVTLTPDLSDFGSGFGPVAGETVRDTLDGRHPDVMNHWTAPDRVRTVNLSVFQKKIRLPALSVSAIECE